MLVGYIGLGDIGTPIAWRLLKRQGTIILWNRTNAKTAPFVAEGADAAGSAAEVAERCDAIVICVNTEEGVREILFGANGVTSAKAKPAIVIDHSTIHPTSAKTIGEELARLGIGFVDAPVSGAANGAKQGTLAIFVGGEQACFDLAKPIMTAYASQISHMGPLGAGQVAKACNQIVNFATLAAISEAMALADASGLDARRLPEAMSGGLADCGMLREYVRGAATGENAGIMRLIDMLIPVFHGRFADTERLSLNLLLKDLAIVADISRKSGSITPMIGLAESIYRQSTGMQTRLIASSPCPPAALAAETAGTGRLDQHGFDARQAPA